MGNSMLLTHDMVSVVCVMDSNNNKVNNSKAAAAAAEHQPWSAWVAKQKIDMSLTGS
jgi:hypothetical protein